MRLFLYGLLSVLALACTQIQTVAATPTVARVWNEQLLDAISRDTARPTVHARNLFHVSAAMYDAWSAYDPAASQYLGNEKASSLNPDSARSEAISYAAYNVLLHRFVIGPGGVGPGRSATVVNLRDQMVALGYDPDNFANTGDSPAAVGNRIAQSVIDHGLSDGANEANRYANPAGQYLPLNAPLTVEDAGVILSDPNRWQPLNFRGDRIDQFGSAVLPSTQTNLTPYWGEVTSFGISTTDRSTSGVYFDQGAPPQLGGLGDAVFKAGALAMIRYSSQLDPNDGVMIDISPASRGNAFDSPFTESYSQPGYTANPVTGQPYEPQLVNRGDFTRLMAEFWADGPRSTAPPGHWNEIRNDITDQMESLGIAKQIGGAGQHLSDLEWDVKSMFALNGGLHDAAIAAWNHKGFYDSSRPISFVRYMGQLGQSSDPSGPSYSPDGLPLEPGLIEVVTSETTAVGQRHEGLLGHEGEIAVRGWSGAVDGSAPFEDPSEIGGVDWILAEEWLPYQLSSFVTPPFPGYVSGHSTFSRVGAEVMTLLTGSPIVPGGLFEYQIPAGDGLGFEYGPTEPLSIQFASYFDAADLAAESRLWGGIHPPQDDFTGRRIGQLVGEAAWQRALGYFESSTVPEPTSAVLLAIAGVAFLGSRPSVNPVGKNRSKKTNPCRMRTRNVTAIVSRIGACIVGLFATASAGAVTFTDVTAAAGINHVQTIPELIQGLPGEAFFSGGAAAGDFDGDGHVDLVFTRLNDNDTFYRNRGDGTFEARTSAAGFRFPTYTNGVVSGDVDNDGDLDLYMTTVGYTRNYLYLNDGNGYFTDAGTSHPAALASNVVRSGQGASFGDYDRDGFLDLATGDWGNTVASSQSRLLRNLGTDQPGGFEDVTAASGIDAYRGDKTYRFVPRFVDLDRDGHADLTFAGDFQSSQLFWNNGDGTFTDGTLAAGVGTDLNGMGSTFGDYDGDGDLDWFITNITNDPQFPGPFGGYNRLYRNDGDRQFTDVTQAAGVRDARWSWGTTFFDYDNDGDSDLAATNGYNGNGWSNDRTFLWENTDSVFADVSDASGVTDTEQGRGLIHLDYDSDGDLDLLVVNHAAAPVLYRNDGGNANHYLRIETEGVLSNRDGIGAWITVTPDLTDPDQQLVWEIDGGSSFVSQNERTAHFGLGPSADLVDLVTIEWPSGIVQRLYDVAVDQTLRVIESAAALPGDYNDDGVVDAADYTIWRDNINAHAGTLPNDTVSGAIGQAQYDVWVANFGATLPAESFTVPEPSAGLLVTGLLAGLGLRGRRTVLAADLTDPKLTSAGLANSLSSGIDRLLP